MKNDDFNSHYQVEILNSVSIKDITTNYILGCNKVYYIYANYGLLHLLSDEFDSHPSCKLTKDEAEKRYKKLRGSKFGKKILEKNENAVCSYCLHSRADELDHYLIKSKYPSYYIVYNNLIPACSQCNKKKGMKLPKDEIWFIQPNFEKIPESFFLNVYFDSDYRAIFEMPPIYTNDKNYLLMKKMEYTFNHLLILKEYSRLAHQELSIIVRMHLNNNSKNKLSNFLQERCKAFCQAPNKLWERSLYNFLRQNKDFIEGGYISYAQKFNISNKSQELST